MVRASADPRSAIESKTSSMPLTVPISPSSGDSGTRTRSRVRLDVMPPLSREIIADRTWRAHHERWSLRACHSVYIRSASWGRMRQKYHNRSMTSVDMMTPHVKIQNTNGPPPATRSRTASTGFSSQSSMAFLNALREQPGALLIEQLHDLSRECGQESVGEKQRDCDAETQHRRDHGRAD